MVPLGGTSTLWFLECQIKLPTGPRPFARRSSWSSLVDIFPMEIESWRIQNKNVYQFFMLLEPDCFSEFHAKIFAVKLEEHNTFSACGACRRVILRCYSFICIACFNIKQGLLGWAIVRHQSQQSVCQSLKRCCAKVGQVFQSLIELYWWCLRADVLYVLLSWTHMTTEDYVWHCFVKCL